MGGLDKRGSIGGLRIEDGLGLRIDREKGPRTDVGKGLRIDDDLGLRIVLPVRPAKNSRILGILLISTGF